MRKAFYILFGTVFILFHQYSAQDFNNLNKKKLFVSSDSLLVDTLSIVPHSELLMYKGVTVDKSNYEIDYPSSIIYLKDKTLIGREIELVYRVFPLSFVKTFEHKKITEVEKQGKTSTNPFSYEYSASNEDIFYLNGLNKSGSISRGVAFGNNQDISVNSSLNLQLSGKVSQTVNILASISDDNIPIQAEGNTQQLQEFDKVFIQLFSDQWRLTAGDFYLKRPDSYFMNFNKRAQGGSFEMQFNTGKKKNAGIMKPTISAAVSKGKFARNKILGVEGNQGPYRLQGAENELFIIVLSGTENVYIDGQLMKRGNEFDYIIDYNTAEITFTANRLITKDKRIVVEFQYSDRNYARSLVHFGNEFKNEKLQLNVNVYSEQDAKNQPLQQDLTEVEKLLLSNIGDSLQNAIVPNVNLVDFSENLVLYKMVDTLGYDSVFVYDTDPDSAKYQLGFSFVGPNKGDYIQIQSAANGKVYQWQMPVAGVPQGDYAPVILLVTPKIRQMATLGGEYQLSKGSLLSWEGAISNNDINTFSDKDAKDDVGYAFKINSENRIKLSANEKNPWSLNVGAGYEFVDFYFNPIERFRTVEFERDWNIINTNFTSDQNIATAYVGLEKKKKGNLLYDVTLLNNEGEYEGFKNAFSALYNIKNFLLDGNISYLTTEGLNNTTFLRHKLTISKPISFMVLGVREEVEKNKFFFSTTDSLLASSFEFRVLEAFVRNADTTINNFMFTYRQREDLLPLNDAFASTTLADDIEFSLGLLKSKNHKFRSKFTYRKLKIVAPSLTAIQPEENILSRVEYVAKFLKNVISSNTYYEVGSGLEVKKEFSFVEVQPSQGTHAYIGDLNENGVKDLNEFEVAAFQDQANFIKIFTPTNEFVRTYTNQFNQGLFLRPESIWGSKKGMKKLLSRFSNRTNYRVSRKVSNKLDYYNPFIGDIADSNLVTLNLGFLNTFYFNRTGTKFGADFTFQDNRDRSLITSGIESRQTLNRVLKTRWNITRVYTINILAANGFKLVNSEFFTNRNFNLTVYELEPKLTIQPSSKFRASVWLNYKEKLNEEILGGEEAISKNIGGEVRYNMAAKGSFRAKFNYIENKFSITDNASLAYEMLEGLQSGVNLTWEATYQQNLSKHMQMSINYSGRKSDEIPVIHTGGVQVRAFF